MKTLINTELQLADNQRVMYLAKGLLIGKDWGLDISTYPTIEYSFNTLEELELQIREDLKSAAIDSGMGYDVVYACQMLIEVNTTILINNKVFRNVEYQTKGYWSPEALDLEKCSEYYNILEEHWEEWLNNNHY
jgi:hypothetical protein